MLEAIRELRRNIYYRYMDLRGLGHMGPEWMRRLEVIRRVHQDALQLERSELPPSLILDHVGAELTRAGIGWVDSKYEFAVKADFENRSFPRVIIAKHPGRDRNTDASGWLVYYEGEATEREEYPEKFIR